MDAYLQNLHWLKIFLFKYNSNALFKLIKKIIFYLDRTVDDWKLSISTGWRIDIAPKFNGKGDISYKKENVQRKTLRIRAASSY